MCKVEDKYERQTEYHDIYKVPCYGCGTIVSIQRYIDEQTPQSERITEGDL